MSAWWNHHWSNTANCKMVWLLVHCLNWCHSGWQQALSQGLMVIATRWGETFETKVEVTCSTSSVLEKYGEGRDHEGICPPPSPDLWPGRLYAINKQDMCHSLKEITSDYTVLQEHCVIHTNVKNKWRKGFWAHVFVKYVLQLRVSAITNFCARAKPGRFGLAPSLKCERSFTTRSNISYSQRQKLLQTKASHRRVVNVEERAGIGVVCSALLISSVPCLILSCCLLYYQNAQNCNHHAASWISKNTKQLARPSTKTTEPPELLSCAPPGITCDNTPRPHTQDSPH